MRFNRPKVLGFVKSIQTMPLATIPSPKFSIIEKCKKPTQNGVNLGPRPSSDT